MLLLTSFVFIYSFFAINNSFQEFDTEDPQEIVIDEVVGQLLVLIDIPIYDTLYPLPIRLPLLPAPVILVLNFK